MKSNPGPGCDCPSCQNTSTVHNDYNEKYEEKITVKTRIDAVDTGSIKSRTTAKLCLLQLNNDIQNI